MRKKIIAADLFCGAGGTSTGLALACQDIGIDLDLLAVNHWNVAIESHSRNHPEARHLCESLDNVDPRKMFPGGRISLMVASPECVHHSNARGGKPMNDQSRASAWHVLRWAEALYIENILIENVPEFRTWGPIGANGRPLPSKKGQTFQAFLDALRSLGYTVDHRVLNAANYGDPTTRERLFIQARRNRPITWPSPTHHRSPQPDLFGGNAKPWRPARDIIDWSLPGESIFQRKKPLAQATMERIAAGLQKFGGAAAEPFLVILRNHMGARSMDEPVPTIAASGNHVGLCVPFLLGAGGTTGQQRPQSIDEPIGAVLTQDRRALIQPFILPLNHGKGDIRTYSMENPMPTVTSVDAWGMVEPFLLPHRAKDGVDSVDKPMRTVTATSSDFALVQPFLVPYNSNGDDLVRSVEEPVGTVTTRDRWALVQGCAVDIRFRMLQPHELAAAMSFPADYKLAGNREQRVKQIGNAVPVGLAKALCAEILRASGAREKAA